MRLIKWLDLREMLVTPHDGCFWLSAHPEEFDGNGSDWAVKFFHWALHNHIMLAAYHHIELLWKEQVNQCFCVLAFLTYWFPSRIETNE